MAMRYNITIFKKKGVTLIEMAVVMGIFALILLVLYSGYVSGMRIWRAFSKGGIATNRRLWLGLEKLSRDIKSSFACGGIEFKGDEDSFSFPVVYGYEVVEVEYSYRASRNTLYRSRTKYRDLLNNREAEKKEEMFKAEKLEFSYLYFDSDKITSYWSSEWLLEGEPPKAVRLELESDEEKIEKLIFIPAA